ncbi:MAG: hypothetical protein KGI38_10565 [Thaumarchaeota archaeon]|nr:hypothetical protein [Nitrososphaerota archaeon]
MSPRTELAAAIVALLLAGTFFLAPVVPYSASLGIVGNYQGTTTCSSVSSTYSAIVTSGSVTYSCLVEVPYQPVAVGGYATPSYALLGYGAPPYPTQAQITQGNSSALIFFQGARAVAAERIGPAGTVVNSPDLAVVRTTFVQAAFGEQNFTAVIRNSGPTGILIPTVAVQMEEYGENQSVGGLTWFEPDFLGHCGDSISYVLSPGTECKVSALLSLPYNVTIPYYVVVVGVRGGQHLFTRQKFIQSIPAEVIGPAWVGDFISNVNQARGSNPLAENSTLDAFAAFRFIVASSQPDISDYGFANSTTVFFGSGAAQAGFAEEILFPGGFAPGNYGTYLSEYAPGHWTGLTDTAYNEFGYFVGQAPYYTVSSNCPVTEVPSGGVNITQYFESHGCTVTPVGSTTWLVIVLGK